MSRTAARVSSTSPFFMRKLILGHEVAVVFKYDGKGKWTDHTHGIDSGITQLDTMGEGDPDGDGLCEIVYDRSVLDGGTDSTGDTIVKVVQHISESGSMMALYMG